MNLRQGCIGRQESLCMAAIAACSSGLFTFDSSALYSLGNSAYITMLASAAIALIIFALAVNAMAASGHESLWALLRSGLGAFFSRVVALIYVLLLLACAAMLLSRFTLMMVRFVFPGVLEWKLIVYLAPVVFMLAWKGLESIGRTSRLFIWLLLISLLGSLLLAAFNYKTYRLAPYLGDGIKNILGLGIKNALLFFPALLGLLIVARGVHGPKMAKRTGYSAAIAAGLLCSSAQLCLGMTFSYSELSKMHSPMYRLTMNFRSGGYFQRLDKLLFFGWVISSMLAAGYYVYAASFLFAGAFEHNDIRPSVAVFSVLIIVFTMLMHSQAAIWGNIERVISGYGLLLAAIPLLLASLLARLKSPKKNMQEKES